MKSGRFVGLDRELRAKNEFERSREEETVYEDPMLLEAKGLLFLLDRILPATRKSPQVDLTPVINAIHRLEERIDNHMDKLNTRLTAIEAGIRRFDNFTIRTYQEVHEMKKTFTSIEETKAKEDKPTEKTAPVPLQKRKRIPKAEVLEEVIEAAKILLKENKRLTMSAVADLTGLSYGRVVYACGTIDNLREMANKALQEEEMTHGGKNSES